MYLLLQKKNQNTNNISNEQEEEAPLKSAIALEVRRLERISNELDNAQNDEALSLIEKYAFNINKIISFLNIKFNI